MGYRIILTIIRFLLRILNGKTEIQGKENLPTDGGYVFISPHRSWLDPVYLALAGYPRQYCFMAKKELFKNPLLAWLIRQMNAFPVDRENPGISAIKIPVTHLKEGKLGLVMFPSGTRHSDEAKDGAAAIARLAKVPIIPAVYQGPLTFKALLSRQKTRVKIGEPIYIDSKEAQQQFASTIKDVFNTLDHELDPSFTYTYDKTANQ